MAGDVLPWPDELPVKRSNGAQFRTPRPVPAEARMQP